MQFSVALVAALASVAFANPGHWGGGYPTTPAGETTECSTYTAPAQSTAPTYPTYPTSEAESSAVYPTSYPVAPSSYPVGTPPAASSYPVAPSSYPVGTPPAASSYPVASSYPATSPQVSVQTISTCVPTVLYSTVTIGTPGSAPYPTSAVPSYPAGSPPSGSGAASGTGAPTYPTTSSYPITPAKGAGNTLTNSMMGVAAAAVAAIVLA